MKFKAIGGIAAALLLAPVGLRAQALFQGFSFPRTVTATGQTEVVGPVIASLHLGSTAAGTLVFNISPFRITNANATDISVEATDITVGATSIDAENGLVKIPVNAGATSGSIRIDGVRVAVAGTEASSINATLSWENSVNIFTSGSNLTVVNSVQSGLTVAPITDKFSIFNGQVYDNTSTISLHEGYPTAFSSSTSFGQTVTTRVRIRVTDFPTNLQMTFPTTVTAKNSGATLTTLEGAAVTLPRSNENTEVTYAFSGVAGSDNITEDFDIPFTVNLTGAVGNTLPTIELSLAPIGSAVPDSSFPSTDIPRYSQDDVLAQAGSSRIITKVLYWTGTNTSFQNQFNIVNPSSDTANLTIDAFDTTGAAIAGEDVTNPVKVSLSSNQSLARTTSELFGNAEGITTVRIQSTNSEVFATVVVTGSGIAESVPLISNTTASAYIPVVNEGAKLTLFNPNSLAISGTLTLRTEDNRFVSSTSVTLNALASTSIALGAAFDNPSRGYVFASFPQSLVMFESFGEMNTLNLLPIQSETNTGLIFIPFFVNGNGFQTDINLINASNDLVTLTAEVFDPAGSRVGPAVLITFPPNEQLATSMQTVFPQAPQTGYIRLQVPQLFKAFFPYYPLIKGHARIRSAEGGSTVIALATDPFQDAFIPGAAPKAEEFLGLALANPTGSETTVTLLSMDANGTVLSSSMVTLAPGQLISRLATEFFNAALTAQSVIRVSSTAPIVAESIIGSNDLETLRSLWILR